MMEELKLINLNEEVSLNTKYEFNRLTKQYENLTKLQKQALITYKSFLFLFMNRIIRIKDYDKIDIDLLYTKIKADEKFYELQDLLDLEFNQRITGKNMLLNPETKFIEPSLLVYKTDPSLSLKNLIESLIPICKTLEEAFGCMVLENDIEVYRGTKGEEPKGKISASPIVSTSIMKQVAFDFVDDDNLKGYNLGNVYKIKVKKGTPVLVCPIGFRIGLQEYSTQYEIMFLNDDVNAIVGKAQSQKTFYSIGENPLTVDCISAIIYPKKSAFTEEEIYSDISQFIPELSIQQLHNQVNTILDGQCSEYVSAKIK